MFGSRKLKRKVEEQERAIEQQMKNRPEYTIPQEYYDILEKYRGTEGDLNRYASDAYQTTRSATEALRRGGSDLVSAAKKAYDINRDRAYSNMPGLNTARMRLGSSTANAISRIQEVGSGIDSMDAIYNTFRNEAEVLQNLSMQDAAYRDSAKRDLGTSALTVGDAQARASMMENTGLMNESNAQLNMGNAALQGSQLVGAGLSNIAGQKEKAYQLNTLDPYYDQLNYKITQAGNTIAQQQAAKNMNLAAMSSFLTPLFNKAFTSTLQNGGNNTAQFQSGQVQSGNMSYMGNVNVPQSNISNNPNNYVMGGGGGSAPVDTPVNNSGGGFQWTNLLSLLG